MGSHNQLQQWYSKLIYLYSPTWQSKGVDSRVLVKEKTYLLRYPLAAILPYQKNWGSRFLQNGGIYLRSTHHHKKRNSSNYMQRIISFLAVKCHYSHISLLYFHDCLRKYVKFPHTMNISALQLENWRLWEGSEWNAISSCLHISACTTVKNCGKHGGDSSTQDIWKGARNLNL
jgi:hypothetical protein